LRLIRIPVAERWQMRRDTTIGGFDGSL